MKYCPFGVKQFNLDLKLNLKKNYCVFHRAMLTTVKNNQIEVWNVVIVVLGTMNPILS